jgi:hypothetical protein
MASNPQKWLRIGILTLHRCINYGSYWQTRCLVEWLQRRGYAPVVLHHFSRSADYAELRCAFRPHRPARTRIADLKEYGKKVRSFECSIGKLPLSTAFPLDVPSLMDDFDLIIVGSDEVWNFWHPWYGGHSLFFGDQARAPRIISYAASFGNFSTPDQLQQPWAAHIDSFAAVSVRDFNSRSILENTLAKDVAITADPVLLNPNIPGPMPLRGHDPYIAVYGHSFSDGFTDDLRHTARLIGLPLVSIGYRNDWADEQWISAGPDEFAAFIAHSEAVVTNFFHGCIFSLLDKRPFVAEPGWYRWNKITDLAKLLGFTDRLVSDKTPSARLTELLREPIARSVTNAVTSLRDSSEKYLIEELR